MGHPIVTTVTLGAASATGYAQAQALAGAGALALNGALVTGGVGTPDAPRRVIITSIGNDSALTWTIVGTARPEQGGAVLTETLAGANAASAQSTQDFASVTSITASAATAGNVTAGTNGVGSGPWVPWDQDNSGDTFLVSIMGNVLSGAPTWEVEYTYDDVYGLWLPSNVPFPRPRTLASMQGLAADQDGGLTMPVRASRLTLRAIGSVQLTQTQQGI